MHFRVLLTTGGEVKMAGASERGRPVYYGAVAKTGEWRVNVPKFETLLAAEFEPLSFGSSIESYVFGLEIAELEEWGKWFTATREYVSYRPKTKTIVSIGQIEWKRVKDLPAVQQLSFLREALVSSIEHVAAAKRKPRDFNLPAFADAARVAVEALNPFDVIEGSP